MRLSTNGQSAALSCGLGSVLIMLALPVSAGTISAGGVDLDKFKQKLASDLNGNVVGYGFAIAKGGKVWRRGAGGWAQRPGDGNKKMRPRTRINVMSATKTWTAVATLQLLKKRGLGVDAKIYKWLPKTWLIRGKGFRKSDSLTFRQLLTHTSGLDQRFKQLKAEGKHGSWKNGWDGIKFVVRKGTHAKKSYAYKNMNYALLRVLVPRLAGRTVTKANYAGHYLRYLRRRIARPSGVKQLTCRRLTSRPHAKAYNVNSPNSAGSNAEAGMQDCGGHANFQLSAVEMAKFMTTLRCRGTSSKLLSKSSCQQMDQLKLGWQRSSNQGSNAGLFFHGGDRVGSNQIHTCQMKFPGNVEAALVTNSASKNGRSACGMLKAAYNLAK
ncbi:MAG: beta-lactamase family protein [Hyphomicrobiaceae bacterium]